MEKSSTTPAITNNRRTDIIFCGDTTKKSQLIEFMEDNKGEAVEIIYRPNNPTLRGNRIYMLEGQGIAKAMSLVVSHDVIGMKVVVDLEEKRYRNKDITVTWRAALCAHSGNCMKGLESVFSLGRPWINMDGAPTEDIVSQVDKCPSGALSCFVNTHEKKVNQ